MALLKRDRVQRHLRRLGWTKAELSHDGHYHQALEDFQRGWANGPALLVDGKHGKLTDAALREAVERKRAGEGTASPHFSYAEWACKCGGKYKTCRRVVVWRELLKGLEELRAEFYPGGLSPISGYRCYDYNRIDVYNNTGSGTGSQHIYGDACDIPATVPIRDVARLRRFSGIGIVAATGHVAHVDVRHIAGHNNGGYPDKPMTWFYY